MAEDENL